MKLISLLFVLTIINSLTLKNGIEVVLEKGKKIKVYAISGSGARFDKVLGSSHLIEHNILLNSAHPTEIYELLNKNGESYTGFTDLEMMTIGFTATEAIFKEVIEKFSKLFLKPHFNSKLMAHERIALDGEFRRNVMDGDRRAEAALKHISHSGSMLKIFTTGNMETLGKIDPSQLEPKFKEMFSANNLKFIIRSNKPKEELEKLLNHTLGNIPNHNLTSRKKFTPPFSKENLSQVLQIDSVSGLSFMKLHFILPDGLAEMENNYGYFIEKVLVQDGEKTFKHYCSQNQKYILSYSVELSHKTRGNSILKVYIELSEEGKKHTMSVFRAIMGIIEYSRDKYLNASNFKKIKEKVSKYKIKWHSNDKMKKLAHLLFRRKSEDIKKYLYNLGEYNSTKIKPYKEALSIKNMILILYGVDSISEFSSKTREETEPYMKFQMKIGKIDWKIRKKKALRKGKEIESTLKFRELKKKNAKHVKKHDNHNKMTLIVRC